MPPLRAQQKLKPTLCGRSLWGPKNSAGKESGQACASRSDCLVVEGSATVGRQTRSCSIRGSSPEVKSGGLPAGDGVLTGRGPRG